MDQSTAELIAATAPEVIIVHAGGAEYRVGPLKWRQFGPVMRAAWPLLDGLMVAFGGVAQTSSSATGQSHQSVPMHDSADMRAGVELLLQNAERITDLLAAALEVDQETIEACDPSEIYRLLRAVTRTNLDFFSQHVLPTILEDVQAAGNGGLAERIAALTSGAGQTPSSS